jgi:uncharacterized protein YhbP (UPF0306 family)
LSVSSHLEQRLRKLLVSQRLAVLATQQKKNPYTSLVAFASSEDMHRIVFATPKTTRKFANMLANSKVSMFFDNRSNKIVDFRNAIGVTALGSARQIRKNKNSQMMNIYLAKHPQLESFLASPSCAFMCMDVESFYVVERFQNVTEIHLK